MPPTSPDSPASRLLARLTGPLDRPTAERLLAGLEATGETAAAADLLDELEDASAKAGQAALEAWPELHRRGAAGAVLPWLDLGVSLAASSGAVALRYFKDSPLVLGLIEPASSRAPVLQAALELADRDANVALEFFRRAPELLATLPLDALAAWAEIGLELAGYDFVLGIEFIRQSPSVARVLPLELVRDWTGFGMKLIVPNSLGKPDYVGTLEFFRTSPAILGDIEDRAARKPVIQVGSVLADRSPEGAIAFLAEAPRLLRRLPGDEWRRRVLSYGLLLAERDAEAALAYLQRCPDILDLTGAAGEADAKFETWYRGGMEILAYSAEGARAYFALETKKALDSVREAVSGVPLRQVARSLKLFAQGLCGSDVAIRALPESAEGPGKKTQASRARVDPDGRTIALPAVLRRHESREDNFRLYLVMTAHEAGHVEFGTYSLPLDRLADMTAAVARRYGRPASPVESLEGLFALYPQPGLIRDLWTLLEDARVEYRLRGEYPGLQRDLAALAREAVTTRSLLQGMSVREMVVDALLLLTTVEANAFRIPEAIADVVARAWTLCQEVLTAEATAEAAVRLADRVYVLLEDELTARTRREEARQGEEPSQSDLADLGAGPRASEETAGSYRPVTNWAYRGEMNPELVRGSGADEAQQAEARPAGSVPRAEERRPRPRDDAGSGPPREEREQAVADDPTGLGRTPGLAVEAVFELDDRTAERQAEPEGGRRFFYDEWDGRIQDYRMRWCRVTERTAPEGSPDAVEAALAEHGAAVRLLRRYFEALRPPALRRAHQQDDGEDVDLDAVIRLKADLAAGAEPSDRVYTRLDRRERDVAALFLVDLSGSTSRQLESEAGPPRRIIDVEREGLVLLSQALDALGDQYAICGYSGQGRQQVDFVVLKDFDEPAGARIAGRLGGMEPLQQNRDGAAIRHALRRLLARDAKIRLLMLISDGKPLDADYGEEYSLEDTKMALREARMRGVEPFCITVDRAADDYLRRMYGEVRYLILDRAGALPERLPQVYRRLTAHG